VKSKLVLMRILGGLALCLALAACNGGGPNPPQGVNLKVVGQDTFKFEPASLTGKVGQVVTVSLDNKGILDHSFIIDELSVKLEMVKAGTTGQVSFTPGQAGTFKFYCDVPGHEAAGMVGTFTVEP
jgi:uncharacterized cupredoxin-like copper-binding protein